MIKSKKVTVWLLLKLVEEMADDKPFECTQPGCGMVCALWLSTEF